MRKVKDIIIEEEGRDKGKAFHIVEMPALQAEKWATKALIAVAKTGINLPPEIISAGWAGMAFLGVQALPALQFADVEPLMTELMSCVRVRTVGDLTRALVEDGTGDDIEEVQTRMSLKAEVFKLHVGFLKGAVTSKPLPHQETAPNSSITPTSPAPSAQSPRLVRRR